MTFYKYHSLGNDFILLDWLDLTPAQISNTLADLAWPKLVRNLCDRHFGIGADGILIVVNGEKSIPKVLIFNADGSDGQKCLNGFRCVVAHLVKQRHLPWSLTVSMAGENIDAESAQAGNDLLITTMVKAPQYQGRLEVEVGGKKMLGQVVNIGNPHFIILQEVALDWLEIYGEEISRDKKFPAGTNVEFVWSNPKLSTSDGCKVYDVLVCERGVGITLACGTGAAAVAGLLQHLGMVEKKENFQINMQGGVILSTVGNDLNITQKAKAVAVFQGEIDLVES